MKYLKIFLLLNSALIAFNSFTQITDDAIFLQGCFIEVAISECGVYGTSESPPTGPLGEYHGIEVNGLGFIADHEKDGWDENTEPGQPDFCGDYFTPGTPEEGWAIQYGSDTYANHMLPCEGVGSGGPDIDGTVTSYMDASGIKQGIWEGSLEEDDLNITIKQTTTFPNGALFFLTSIEVCNEGTEDIIDFYYMRNVDPDQDRNWCGTHGTFNEIIYQPPTSDTALVTSIGDVCGCFLGMGAIDSRARVSWGAFFTDDGTPEDSWNGTGVYSGSGSTSCDCGQQITFKFDIPAGECETIHFAHILDISDLEEALEATLTGGVGITANGEAIPASGEYGICNPGDTVIIQINGDSTVTWSITPDTYLDVDTGTYIIANPLVTTTYTITGIGGECGDVTTDLTIVVDDEEIAVAGEDEAICFGLSTTLNGSGGEEYLWSPSTGLSDPEIANPVASPTVTTTYQLTTFDEFNCPAYDEVTIVVNPLPTIDAGPDGQFCIDGEYQLGATGAVSYEWSPTDGLDNPNISNPVTTVDDATTYTVTGTDANGCINTDEISVTVDALPTVTATASPYSIDAFLGETTQLNVVTGGVSFSWEPTTNLSNPNIQNPVANPGDTTIYTVTVVDENGCVNTDTVIVNALGEITINIFNAFSPNGDGLNDTYYPIVQGSGTLVDYQIYNRWGELVYTGGPGDMGLGMGWNGEIKGKTADIGTYVIIVNATTSLGDARFDKSNFMLVR